MVSQTKEGLKQLVLREIERVEALQEYLWVSQNQSIEPGQHTTFSLSFFFSNYSDFGRSVNPEILEEKGEEIKDFSIT